MCSIPCSRQLDRDQRGFSGYLGKFQDLVLVLLSVTGRTKRPIKAFAEQFQIPKKAIYVCTRPTGTDYSKVTRRLPCVDAIMA
jgi:hypothetical protein